jgi:hypothetical protein
MPCWGHEQGRRHYTFHVDGVLKSCVVTKGNDLVRIPTRSALEEWMKIIVRTELVVERDYNVGALRHQLKRKISVGG